MKKTTNPTKQSKRGIALIIALLAVLVLSVLGVSLLFTTDTHRVVSRNYEAEVEATFAALAGLNTGIKHAFEDYELDLLGGWGNSILVVGDASATQPGPNAVQDASGAITGTVGAWYYDLKQWQSSCGGSGSPPYVGTGNGECTDAEWEAAAMSPYDLEKLMLGSHWAGVLVQAPNGDPVGFELALERTLQVRDKNLRAFYVTALTVSAEHRGRGLGRLVLEGINQLVFDKCGADLILSTFHEGHSGSPAVQSTFDRIEGFCVHRFHQSPVYSRRLDKDPLPQLEQPPRAKPLNDPTQAETIEVHLREHFEVSFALEASLASQYLQARNISSGFWRYDLPADKGDSEAPLLIGWNLLPMAYNERDLPPIGQLQFLFAPDRSAATIERALHDAATRLHKKGCFAVSVLDMGTAPISVLERLGFAATETLVTFAARGPIETIDTLEGVSPPFFYDFT